MLLLSFLLFFLYERAGFAAAQSSSSSTVGTTIPVLRVDGQSVVLAGEMVRLSCYGRPGTAWYRLDQATGRYHMVTGDYTLTFNATVEDSGEYMCSDRPFKTYYSAVILLTIVEKMSPLQVVATPGYPIIVEGQRLTMHCKASTLPPSVVWSWYRLEDQERWHKVGTSRDLTLTKAEESGQYRCRALSNAHDVEQMKQSPNHTVNIIFLPATAGGSLGIAAFCLSLLALIILFTVLPWLGRQRANGTAALQALTTTHTTAKGFAGPGKSPKGNQSKSEGEGEVYMNYTSNQAYCDLKPTFMTGDGDMYSNLS